jgi:hypothetical protein
MTVTMKNNVFWDVAPSVSYLLTLFLPRVISSTLKMVTTYSSETSVYNKPTRRHIPETDPVWRRVRIPPPQSLRVVRGDEGGTQSQMRR